MTLAPDRDILIARIIDAEASPEDWAAVRALAERDPAIWSDLAAAQQDQADLCAALGEAIRIADEVELPEIAPHAIVLRRRLRFAGAAGGWLAAAALLLAWWINPINPGSGGAQAGLGPTSGGSSPDEALQAYLESGAKAGRVLGESPDLIIQDSRPLEDGSGVEILYVRQIVERMVVDQMYRASIDERGIYIPVPVSNMPSGRRRM